MLPGTESTVTEDIQASGWFEAGNGTVYGMNCSLDQIFVSSNIEPVNHCVVDSNLYPSEFNQGAPVSDHCMIYADLKFDFDAVMQKKLKAIATGSLSN